MRSLTPWHFGAALLCIGWLPLVGQIRQVAPEATAYIDLSSTSRLRLLVLSKWQDGAQVQEQIGSSFDIYFDPIVKLRRIFIFDRDEAKSRAFTISPGYRYLSAGNNPPEHRLLCDVTFRLPLEGGTSLSNQNQIDFRLAGKTYSWLYRNLLQMDRPIEVRHLRFDPYISAEASYNSRYTKWSETALTAGINFPVSKLLRIEGYYQHKNQTGTGPTRKVDTLGLKLNFFLRH
jgi:hypothetical protein